MPRLLVFQHVAHEILGTLDPLLKKYGFRIRYVNFGRSNHRIPNLKNYDGLVILGGSMNVDQTKEYPYLVEELEAIKNAIEIDIPILGICLGSQLIAKALGAEVYRNKTKEIGWYKVKLTKEGKKDPLISNFNKSEDIFQWHGDTFDIPDGAVCLATSKTCRNQAFRYGNRIYGFQFHLEVDKPMIERWLRNSANKKEIEELNGLIDPEVIKDETPKYIKRLKELSGDTFTKFIELFGDIYKKEVLPSR
ncbi:MAG: amidotransferase [Candidatus Dadabacteria bacterium]|nr:amidotransferase [Candidatus Dadabacteria bacterium]NIQ15779.1 amidotransferase [Candidatus Dadabacteria bacterium]